MYQVHAIDGDTGNVLQKINRATHDHALREDAAQTTQLASTGHYSIIVNLSENQTEAKP